MKTSKTLYFVEDTKGWRADTFNRLSSFLKYITLPWCMIWFLIYALIKKVIFVYCSAIPLCNRKSFHDWVEGLESFCISAAICSYVVI